MTTTPTTPTSKVKGQGHRSHPDRGPRGHIGWIVGGSLATGLVAALLMEVGDPFMMRKQLHNLKRRAEQLAAARRSATAGAGGQQGIAMDGSMLAPNRGRLAVIEAEADIDRSPAAVFDYCSDPSREPEWNIKMTKAEQLTDGPIGVGARWRMAFASAPSVLSECVRFERPRVWELVGRSKVMTSGWRGRVLPSGAGARLLLRMELQLHGPLGLATPLLGRRMQPELERDLATIKANLEQTA
jgi:hypothetical protein